MVKDSHGFTLIEILAAIVILALLLSTLFGSFRLLSASGDALGKGSLAMEMARGCLSRITADLEAVYVVLPPAYAKSDGGKDPDPYRFEGDSTHMKGESFSRLRFASFEHLPLGQLQTEGVAEIVYYVHQDRDGRLVLRRSDRLFPHEKFEEKSTDPILCRDIRGLTFTYADSAGKEYETWDSESSENGYATPRSVAVRLSIGDEDHPSVFRTRIFLPVSREEAN